MKRKSRPLRLKPLLETFKRIGGKLPLKESRDEVQVAYDKVYQFTDIHGDDALEIMDKIVDQEGAAMEMEKFVDDQGDLYPNDERKLIKALEVAYIELSNHYGDIKKKGKVAKDSVRYLYDKHNLHLHDIEKLAKEDDFDINDFNEYISGEWVSPNKMNWIKAVITDYVARPSSRQYLKR